MVNCIVLLSGKRKSGKDYFSAKLKQSFEETYPGISIDEVRLSGPLKESYAKEHNLDFQLLLSADSYKEEHREKMIKFGEDKRDQDPGYWCRAATENSSAKVWIVVDCRRETDVDYFVNNYPGLTIAIRIQALDEVKIKRGYSACSTRSLLGRFKFTTGIDDFPSECGLDNYSRWDYILDNNNNATDFDSLPTILEEIRRRST